MTCRCCRNEDRHTSQVRGIELCDECAEFLRSSAAFISMAPDRRALVERIEHLHEARKLAETVEPDYMRHVLLGAIDSQPACDYLFELADAMRSGLLEAALTASVSTAQVQALAKALHERVLVEHDNATHWPAGSERYGHKGEFETCPHEECRLVQADDLARLIAGAEQ